MRRKRKKFCLTANLYDMMHQLTAGYYLYGSRDNLSIVVKVHGCDLGEPAGAGVEDCPTVAERLQQHRHRIQLVHCRFILCIFCNYV